MSSAKMGRNFQSDSGISFPNGSDGAAGDNFATVIAAALRRDFGETHAAIKTVANLTNANERAVKNWFMAKNGPTGKHLVKLFQASNEVLEAVLIMSGRHELIVAKKFADSRQVLVKMLELIDALQCDGGVVRSTCIKCGQRTYEMILFAPLGSSKTLAMVQCAACGVPIGAFDPVALPRTGDALNII